MLCYCDAIVSEILKRLDDPTERVRLTTLKSLPVLLSNSPENFKDAYFRAHHELIVDSLLTHFDDDDEIIQNLVFGKFHLMKNLKNT